MNLVLVDVDDTETVYSDYLSDSCSTLSLSQEDELSELKGSPPASDHLISLFPHADEDAGYKVTSSPPLPDEKDCILQLVWGWKNAAAPQLPPIYVTFCLGGESLKNSVPLCIGRKLLLDSIRCLQADGLAVSDAESLLPCISRRHIDACFYVTETPQQGYACRSFDMAARAPSVAVRGVPFVENHRYHLEKVVGDSVSITVGSKCTLEIALVSELPPQKSGKAKRAAAPRKSAAKPRKTIALVADDPVTVVSKRTASRRSAAASRQSITAAPRTSEIVLTLSSSCTQDSESHHHRASTHSLETTIYTTGMRLSDEEEAQCEELGLRVNPDLKHACSARILVVQEPLMRSVKLLTVLPHVEHVVNHHWLHAVLTQQRRDVDVSGYAYSERRSESSIETVNEFSLCDTLLVPVAQRRQLLSPHTFWVHASTKPQDAPINDLKSVIIASGGVLTRKASDATVLVLPSREPSRACWTSLRRALGGSAVMDSLSAWIVIPDDIFRAVLQQRRLSGSTVSTLATPAVSQDPGSTTRKRGSRKGAPSSTPARKSARRQ